jgi:hypothetical protein
LIEIGEPGILLQRWRVQCGEIGLRFFDALGGRLLEPQALTGETGGPCPSGDLAAW